MHTNSASHASISAYIISAMDVNLASVSGSLKVARRLGFNDLHLR